MTKGYNCTVKCYWNKKKGVHYFRYPLPSERVDVRTNKNGEEVPVYKSKPLRTDEYIKKSWYNQNRWYEEDENGYLPQSKRAWNKKTEEELNKMLYERQRLVDIGIIPYVDDKIDLDAEDFFAYLQGWLGKNRYAKSTVSSYYMAEGRLRKFCKAQVLPFSKINNDFLKRFEIWCGETPFTMRGKISQVTINKMIANIEYICYQALNEGLIDKVAFTKRKKTKAKSVPKEYLTKDELNRIINQNTPYPVIRRWFLFSCFSGLPFAESQTIKWGDIKTYDSHSVLNYVRHKTKEPAQLPLNRQAMDILGERLGNDDLVFPLLRKTNTLYDGIKEWVKSAGINKKITPHSGRTTFASLYYEETKDAVRLMKLLGHKDLKTTLRYIENFKNTSEEAVPDFDLILG